MKQNTDKRKHKDESNPETFEPEFGKRYFYVFLNFLVCDALIVCAYTHAHMMHIVANYCVIVFNSTTC